MQKSAQTPIELKKLKSEVEILRQVKNPHIIAVKNYDGKNVEYEPVLGRPITHTLIKSLSLNESISLFIQIAKALEVIHELSIIHKDIKPEHIYYDTNQKHATLVGFDLASQLSRSVPFMGPENLTGTLRYMAPEQTGRMAVSMDEKKLEFLS